MNMKAMLLAAGRGERLRPLTDATPKPLVQVGDHCLIEWHIKRLQQAGINEIIINISYLGDQIKNKLGDGHHYDVDIFYSEEPTDALETGGGIVHALALLGEQPFVVINSDVWTDYPFSKLKTPQGLAHLVMVSNPLQHPQGDFVLHNGVISDELSDEKVTFSGIGIYRPELFADCSPGRFPLAPILRNAMANRHVSGELYTGSWDDIGTLERLQNLRQRML